jgi:hypothetical protein
MGWSPVWSRRVQVCLSSYGRLRFACLHIDILGPTEFSPHHSHVMGMVRTGSCYVAKSHQYSRAMGFENRAVQKVESCTVEGYMKKEDSKQCRHNCYQCYETVSEGVH